MPIKKSDMSIAHKGTEIEKVISFLIKGKKIIPASIGVKFGGCGITLLKISIRVKKIMPFR